MEKFDKEIKKEFKDIAIIEYGIVEGNNTIVFIKAGQNGSLYGYQNKYIRMAKNVNKKYGCSVICSSNPLKRAKTYLYLIDKKNYNCYN